MTPDEKQAERPPKTPKLYLRVLPRRGDQIGVLLDLPAPEEGGGWRTMKLTSLREAEMRFRGEDAFEQGFKAALDLANICLEEMHRESAESKP